jgi:hypothetical protein
MSPASAVDNIRAQGRRDRAFVFAIQRNVAGRLIASIDQGVVRSAGCA